MRRSSSLISNLYAQLLVLWLIVLVAMSVPPGGLPRWRASGALHYVLHSGLFALGALLIWRVFRSRRGQVTGCIILIAFSFALESLEATKYKTPLEWLDVLADAAGVLACFTSLVLARY